MRADITLEEMYQIGLVGRELKRPADFILRCIREYKTMLRWYNDCKCDPVKASRWIAAMEESHNVRLARLDIAQVIEVTARHYKDQEYRSLNNKFSSYAQ